MSKESAEKFLEFVGKDPEILKECDKYDDETSDDMAIFSRLAKDKGFDFTVAELKEAMDAAGELSDE